MAAHHFTSLYGAPAGHRITLSGMPEGEVYGLRGDSLGLCWVYHVTEHSTQSFAGVEVSFPDLAEGRYTISFYDTWSGEWLEGSLEAETVDGILQFTCPDFTADVAVKMKYAGPAGQNGTGQNLAREIRIFPNPCDTFVHVENLDDDHSVRLMNVTGQALETAPALRHTRIRIDLSSYPEGIYLLEIRDGTGSPEIHRIVVM